MKDLIYNVQYKLKSSSAGLMVFFFRVLTGSFVGLILALIGQEIVSYGPLSFWFVLVATTAVFARVSKPWGAFGVLVFNLIIVLVGLVLRMYIVMAPDI